MIFNTDKYGISFNTFLQLQAHYGAFPFNEPAKPVAAQEPRRELEVKKEAVDLGIKEDSSAEGGFVRVFEIKDTQNGEQTFMHFPVSISDDAIADFLAKKNIKLSQEKA
jgi:hypothetical protein